MSTESIIKSIMEMFNESPMHYVTVMTLQKYNVTITYDSTIEKYRGYVVNSSTYDASPEESADLQHAIDLIVIALIQNLKYIILFQQIIYLILYSIFG